MTRGPQLGAMRNTPEKCPGCGLVAPQIDGPTHPYCLSSAACWAVYGRVLAREYESREYGRLHQLTVDAYAVQHPGVPERRSIQSVALHLITLCLCLEDGADVHAGPAIHQRLAHSSAFHWLDPPVPRGTMTVADVERAADPAEHSHAVEAWARDVWDAWAVHRATVRGWIATELDRGNPGPSR